MKRLYGRHIYRNFEEDGLTKTEREEEEQRKYQRSHYQTLRWERLIVTGIAGILITLIAFKGKDAYNYVTRAVTPYVHRIETIDSDKKPKTIEGFLKK